MTFVYTKLPICFPQDNTSKQTLLLGYTESGKIELQGPNTVLPAYNNLNKLDINILTKSVRRFNKECSDTTFTLKSPFANEKVEQSFWSVLYSLGDNVYFNVSWKNRLDVRIRQPQTDLVANSQKALHFKNITHTTNISLPVIKYNESLKSFYLSTDKDILAYPIKDKKGVYYADVDTALKFLLSTHKGLDELATLTKLFKARFEQYPKLLDLTGFLPYLESTLEVEALKLAVN
jgi:hypothetical protein